MAKIYKPNFENQIDERWANHRNPRYTYVRLDDNGCGPFSIYNAVSVMSKLKYRPTDPVAEYDWMCNNGHVIPDGMYHGSVEPILRDRYGIKNVTRRQNDASGEVAKSALKKGDWVIALCDTDYHSNRWTRGGHFILVYGLHDNDLIYVSDSASNSNYRQVDGSWAELKACCRQYWIIHDVKSYGIISGSEVTTYFGETCQPKIDSSKLDPYIITLDRKSPKVDWAKLKKKQVTGAIIEAGYLFDANHGTVPAFRNPKAYDQASDAVNSDVPFGYLMYGRARSAAEAEQEMYQLSFLVRKYTPELGVWIDIGGLGSSITVNNNIMSVYQKELIRLGLKEKIGIRVSRQTLDKKITWKSFQADWYLWVVDPVNQLSDIPDLLDPDFFEIDGVK